MKTNNLIKKIAFGTAVLAGLAGNVNANEDKGVISVYGESGIWDSEMTAIAHAYHNACVKARGAAGQRDDRWLANREFDLKKGKICLIPRIYSKQRVTRIGKEYYLATIYIEYDKRDVIDSINSDLRMEEQIKEELRQIHRIDSIISDLEGTHKLIK